MSPATTATPGEQAHGLLAWREIFWPSPLAPAAVTNLLEKWASDAHGPYIVLEARSTTEGLRYLVGAHPESMRRICRDLSDFVAGVIVVPAEPRTPVAVARRLRGRGNGLLTGQTGSATRAILSGMTRVRRDEEVTIQLLLGLRFSPRPPATEPARVDQSMVGKLLHGVRAERRSTVLRDLTTKQTQATIDTVVRIGVLAATAARRQTLAEGVIDGYRTLTSPTARFDVRPEKPSALTTPKVRWRSFQSERRTPGEVALLTAWPIWDDVTGVPILPGQPDAHPKQLQPTTVTPKDARIFGIATAPGTGSPIGITAMDNRQHVRVVGPTGVGKSNLLRSLIRADRAAGRPVIVIEPKDLVHEILSDTTPEQVASTVVIDAADSHPVGVNPLATEGRDPAMVADHLFGVISGLYDDIGPRSSDVLRHALYALAVRGDASLTYLPIILTNPGVRRSLTQRVIREDPVAAAPFWQWFDSLSPEMATQVVSPLMNKIRVLVSPSLRGVLGQSRPHVTIRQVINDGLTLLVPLQAGRLGAENARLLGAVVLAEVWQAVREQVSVSPEQRPTIAVYLDEFQDVLAGFGSDLVGALTQARSLGGAFHLAHQHNDQLTKSVRSAVDANCRSLVAFQLGHGDAVSFARRDARLSADDFTALPRFHFYASIVSGGQVQPFVSGTTLAPVAPVADPADVLAASRQRYGVDRQSIDAEFVALMNSPAEPGGGDIGGKRRRRSA